MGKKKDKAKTKGTELSKEEKKALKEIKKRDKAELIEKLKALPLPKEKQIKAELKRVFGKKLSPSYWAGRIDLEMWRHTDKFGGDVEDLGDRLIISILKKMPDYSEII